MEKLQRKTFQEEHKKVFYAAFFVGIYVPGMERLIKWKWLRFISQHLYTVVFGMSVIYVVGYTHFFFTHTFESKLMFILIIRRIITLVYFGGRPMLYYFKQKEMASLFHDWNFRINESYCVDERKIVLKPMITSANFTVLKWWLMRYTMGIMYNVPFLFDRHARSSELAGFPHDKYSPYHFVYVAFQFTLFAWAGLTMTAHEIIIMYMQTMAVVETTVLEDKLRSVLNEVQIDEDGKVKRFYSKDYSEEIDYRGPDFHKQVRRVERELYKWTEAHKLFLSWGNRVRRFIHADLTARYSYLCVHCCLAILGLLAMRKKAMLGDLSLTLFYTTSSFAIVFANTRLSDMLADRSQRIAEKAYDAAWYLYPRRIQNYFKTLSFVSQRSPIIMFAFKIYKDNSENFLAVLQAAYNALIIILPMTAED